MSYQQVIELPPYSQFGDAFLNVLMESNEGMPELFFIPKFDYEIQNENPLYNLQNKYHAQHPFWFDLYKVAYIHNCTEVSQFLIQEGLFSKNKANYFNFLLLLIQLNLELGNQTNFEALLPKLKKANATERQQLMDKLIYLFINHNLKKNIFTEELKSFSQNYPEEYQNIWQNTYADHLIQPSLATPKDYLIGCMNILESLNNPQNKFLMTQHDMFNIMKGVFSQKNFVNYLLPKEMQIPIFNFFMKIMKPFIEKNEFMELFIKHHMFIPLKYFTYEHGVFSDKYRVQTLFDLAFTTKNVYISFALF